MSVRLPIAPESMTNGGRTAPRLTCPSCGGTNLRVLRTFTGQGRRRRRCTDCGERFNTIEWTIVPTWENGGHERKSRCGQADCPGVRNCLACRNDWTRKNRKRHSELTPLEKLKANARSYANQYKRRGKLKQQPCEKCGSENSQMHHDDYSKPLEVRWFCRVCHVERHV